MSFRIRKGVGMYHYIQWGDNMKIYVGYIPYYDGDIIITVNEDKERVEIYIIDNDCSEHGEYCIDTWEDGKVIDTEKFEWW
jgi:hypothetical protein